MYRRIEEEEPSNQRRQKQTISESHRKGKDGRALKTNHRTRRNRSDRDRKRGAVAQEFDSDNESSDIHLEDEDEDEDEDDIMGYTRIRLVCRPSVKWNTTDCHGSLEISRDGLGLHAIGQENIRHVLLGWSARATIPFFCQTVNPTFSYFEIEVIDSAIGK
jgi:hypothetical protein